jgi:RimJ/RimL family protein N-acetyltransferase
MSKLYRLETERVILRNWRSSDYALFASMNADPEVMRYFPSILERLESDELSAKFDNLVSKNGWGFWIAERKSDSAFLGIVGLNQIDDLPVDNCVEVAWRLAKEHWGNGYATEAAKAALHFAFSILEQDRVAAFTAIGNSASQKVMSRLGMKDRQENFLHPRVPQSSGLKEHVHYQIDRDRFYRDFRAESASIHTEGSTQL